MQFERGGLLAGPVIVNPLRSSLMPGFPNLMHGPLSSCKHRTSAVNLVSSLIVNVERMSPEIPLCAASPRVVTVPSSNADTSASSVKTTHFE